MNYKNIVLCLIVTITLLCSTALAFNFPYTTGPMTPTAQERLPVPIVLSGLCTSVDIVEWRPTPGYEFVTSPDKQSQDILEEVCQLSVNNFTIFVSKYGYNVVEPERNFVQHIALMPADINYHGADVRNLNDILYRFHDRSRDIDDHGEAITIWGYHQRAASYVYIRNDVHDPMFKTIFAHEMFHALSYQYKIVDQHIKNPNATDEILARKFTKYLSLGE